MKTIEELLHEFEAAAASPKQQLDDYKALGKKCIGVLPYYAPEELVHAAGMIPFGIWGSNSKTISLAKEYCATFYCTIAQLALEMLLDGTLAGLSGVITTTLCDTLRPMSQNIRVAMEGKIPTIFLAHPQNRFDENGLQFTKHQYESVKVQLEEIAGNQITDKELQHSIEIYNRFRAESRRFVRLAGQHADTVTARRRSCVLKAAWFTEKEEYTKKLNKLNDLLELQAPSTLKGPKVAVSGIIFDNPELLKIFEENNITIVWDDVAHESRSFKTDVPEDADPMMALAKQFAAIDHDVLLYDVHADQNRRAEYIARMCKKHQADGLILFMQQFCDPEEMEYPYLKKELDAQGIPHIKLGIDQQMRDFGQAGTAILAFSERLQL